MSNKEIINNAKGAPAALGTYSQAIKVGELVFLSGQIGINAETGEMVEGFEAQTRQVYANLQSVCEAAGGSLDNAIKLNVYVMDLANFGKFNEISHEVLNEPYPARALIQAAALPKDALVEVEGILHIPTTS